MKYLKFDVEGSSQVAVKNNIFFNIASARANGYEFVILNFKSDNLEKTRKFAAKILKVMNADGRVKLFILASSFDGANKEELYFRNKYPEMRALCEENSEAIIVKI